MKTPTSSYLILAKALHNKDYRWSVPNDDNRGLDGRELRNVFAFETDFEEFVSKEDASIFEVLIALAIRMEDILAPQKPMADLFWNLLSNLGLMAFSDGEYFVLGGDEKVGGIIETLLDRSYSEDGRGGLFPLKDPQEDQRHVEIWYQMMYYLDENYEI